MSGERIAAAAVLAIEKIPGCRLVKDYGRRTWRHRMVSFVAGHEDEAIKALARDLRSGRLREFMVMAGVHESGTRLAVVIGSRASVRFLSQYDIVNDRELMRIEVLASAAPKRKASR